MIFRDFDFYRDNPQRLWSLYESVYPDSRSFQQRWPWEVEQHPHGNIRVLIAEQDGDLAGMTMRTPVPLCVGGEKYQAWFATNSLVLPRYRGQGVIKKLYDLAAEDGDLHLSKGTAPAMYNRLLKMGYREIVPNTYLSCVVAPLSWVIWRFTGKAPLLRRSVNKDASFTDFSEIDRFDPKAFADFTNAYSSAPAHDADYIKWRYFKSPNRKYRVYTRTFENRTLSYFVLRMMGRTAFLVDLRWETSTADEPGRTIGYIKATARNNGAVKVVTWATLSSLRTNLQHAGFLKRSESPRFSFFSHDPMWLDFSWDQAHFVHGDGDIEYLAE